MKLTNQDIKLLAIDFGLSIASIKAIIAVESGGKGFDLTTKKIIIQFEPQWFKRKTNFTPSGLWSLNGVERQEKEWIAFNNAYALNPIAAMESTSIGLMQVMGFHYKLLGFKAVGDMWDFAKKSEMNQLWLGLKFIQSNKKMYNALKVNDFKTFAYYYNGSAYKRYHYDTRLTDAYNANKHLI